MFTLLASFTCTISFHSLFACLISTFVLCPYYFADMSYVMHAAMICSFDKKEHDFLGTYVLGNTLSFTGLIQQGDLHHYYPVYLDSLLCLNI